jgi:hypothetical protein
MVKEVHCCRNGGSRCTHDHCTLHAIVSVGTTMDSKGTRDHCTVRAIVLVVTPEFANIPASIIKCKQLHRLSTMLYPWCDLRS